MDYGPAFTCLANSDWDALANNEEEGIDAYDGHYAGTRSHSWSR